MMLTYKNVQRLQGQDWYALELSNEHTLKTTLKRIGLAMPKIFKAEPCEAFIPIVKVERDKFEMATGDIIFVRSTSVRLIRRMLKIQGVINLFGSQSEGVSTEGQPLRSTPPTAVEDSYVQTLIERSLEVYGQRGQDVERGSFCRVLDGECARLCGEVTDVEGGWATLLIGLNSFSITLHTPLRNLIDLPGVPRSLRSFYYCDLVTDALNS
jgi:hypothetical protein